MEIPAPCNGKCGQIVLSVICPFHVMGKLLPGWFACYIPLHVTCDPTRPASVDQVLCWDQFTRFLAGSASACNRTRSIWNLQKARLHWYLNSLDRYYNSDDLRSDLHCKNYNRTRSETGKKPVGLRSIPGLDRPADISDWADLTGWYYY